MLSIFKRNKNKREGKDSSVNPSELLGEDILSTDVEVKTELHFPPKVTISTEERYYYSFLNNELPPLKENQISLSGIELKQIDNGYAISAFIRNSLNKGIMFEKKIALQLIGPNDETLGRKEFDLSQLGELPALSSMPWYFIFNDKDLFASEIPTTDWKLAFEIKTTSHSLDLHESWEKSLADSEKKKIAKIVNELDAPKPGEVNFMGLQAQLGENGNLHITILIRNGSTEELTIEKLPLVIEDASDQIIAKGGFTLENFKVKPNTSKPWTFIFPKELLTRENPDLSTWKAYPPQN